MGRSDRTDLNRRLPGPRRGGQALCQSELRSAGGVADKHGGRESNPHGPVLETGTQPIEHPPYGGGGGKWAGRDLNPRSASAADLQSASFNRTWIPTQNKGKSGPGRTRTCGILCVGEASWPLDDGTDVTTKNTKSTKTHEDVGIVEWMGFEPITSCVQGRRSPLELPPRTGNAKCKTTLSGAYGSRTRDLLLDRQAR